MAPPDSTTAPIFIVGTGRSGTSLLRAVLNAHPRIHITQEAGFYRWALPDRLVDCETTGAWFDAYARTVSYRFLQLPPDEVRMRFDPTLGRAHLTDVFTAVMSAQAAHFGRARWGDKTPLHAAQVAQIWDDYPDARVVAVLRDPVATLGSLVRMPWAADSVGANALLVRKVLGTLDQHRDRLHIVRLEDLLSDPRAALEGVLAHIGEAWHDDLLRHAECAPTGRDAALPWFTSAGRPLAPLAPRGSTLTPAERWWAWSLTQELGRRFGYTEPPPRPGFTRGILGALLDIGKGLRFVLRASRDLPKVKRAADIDAAHQLRWLINLDRSDRVPGVYRVYPEVP